MYTFLDDCRIPIDADHLKKQLFDEQQFFRRIVKFLNFSSDTPKQRFLLNFLFVEDEDQPGDGWFAQYHFNASDVPSDFAAALYHILKPDAVAQKVYSIMLDHQNKPTHDDIIFIMSHLKDEEYEFFEVIIEKFEPYYFVERYDAVLRCMVNAIQINKKYHFAGVCCNFLGQNSVRSMNWLGSVFSEHAICDENLEKIFSHISSQVRYKLIEEIIIQERKELHFLLMPVHRSGQIGMSNECFGVLLFRYPLIYLKDEKLLHLFWDSTSFKSMSSDKVHELAKLLLKISKDNTKVTNTAINAVVHLFKTKSVDLSVIRLTKMCSTPVHAAAMIALETGL